jgi:hypothetical protein
MDASVFTEETQKGPTCQSAFKYRVFEVGLDSAVLGRHFVEANGDLAFFDRPGDDVDVLGVLVLDLAEVFGIGTELQDGIHLDDPGDAVVVLAKEGRLIQHIATCSECCLSLPRAITQRLDGMRIRIVALGIQVDDSLAELGDLVAELFQVLLLVLLSVLAQDVGEFVFTL